MEMFMGRPVRHNSPKRPSRGQKKVHKVMHEFKEGTLKSSGEKVTERDQAVAIAMSEAGLSRKKGKK